MKDKSSRPRHSILVWTERLFIVGALAFICYRLGPQFGALLGIGGDLGLSPDYDVTTLDGSRIDSDELRGNVVVLNFWATWCGPCRLEMPSLQSLYEDRASDGLVVLGLTMDTDPNADLMQFLTEKEITYPVGRVTNDHVQAFGGIPMIPTTFLIDRAGVIRHKITGFAAPPVLRIAVDRLLQETAVPSD